MEGIQLNQYQGLVHSHGNQDCVSLVETQMQQIKERNPLEKHVTVPQK